MQIVSVNRAVDTQIFLDISGGINFHFFFSVDSPKIFFITILKACFPHVVCHKIFGVFFQFVSRDLAAISHNGREILSVLVKSDGCLVELETEQFRFSFRKYQCFLLTNIFFDKDRAKGIEILRFNNRAHALIVHFQKRRYFFFLSDPFSRFPRKIRRNRNQIEAWNIAYQLFSVSIKNQSSRSFHHHIPGTIFPRKIRIMGSLYDLEIKNARSQ